MNILLLSAGGPACHGVIKSLKDINFDGKVVSVDCNELSAGFHLSDSYYIVPTASDENYITELLKIVSKEKIDVILPTSSNEIISITKNLDKFNGVKLFMSDYESIVNCSDKLKFRGFTDRVITNDNQTYKISYHNNTLKIAQACAKHKEYIDKPEQRASAAPTTRSKIEPAGKYYALIIANSNFIMFVI